MSTPSLLNIPYRVKGGVSSGLLYSQIPETGAGDFTVTRATTPTADLSTRINSQGFIEVVPNHVARLDYPLGGAVNGCPALLVEPSAQNIAWPSEDFMTSWSISGVTRTADQTVAPNGLATADRISITSNGGFIRRILATSNSTTYTASCFVKNDTITGSNNFRFYFNNNLGSPNDAIARAVIDINAGTVTAISGGGGVSGVSVGIENYGNGWYRVRLTFTLGAAAGGASAEIGFEAITATRTFFAWGAQLEVGSVPTSYIPTTTQPITRAADLVRRTGVTSLIGQSEGTVYFEVEVTAEARDKWFFTLDSAANSFIQCWINTNREINVQILNAGSIVMTTLGSSVLSVGYHKVAFAYNTATNGCVMFIDGVQNPVASRTVTGAGLPAFNNFTFGSYLSTQSDTLKAHVRAGALYPTRIPNTAGAGVLSLATLTAP